MSDTQYVQIKDVTGKWQLFVADDSPEVIQAFQEVFKESDISVVNMETFVRALGKPGACRWRLAILDGTLFKSGKRSSLDQWLAKRNLASKNGLVLIGYSGDDLNKTSRCIRWYVKGTSIRAEVQELRRLCINTADSRISIEDWPASLARPADKLSQALHGLENLAVPIRVDSEALDAVAKGSQKGTTALLEEVWREYFGPDGEVGYFAENRSFAAGSGIEREIGRMLEPIVGLDCVKACTTVQEVVREGRPDLVALGKRFQIIWARDEGTKLRDEVAKTRNADAAVPATAKRLRDVLTPVGNMIRELAGKLREIRDLEEERKEARDETEAIGSR